MQETSYGANKSVYKDMLLGYVTQSVCGDMVLEQVTATMWRHYWSQQHS